MEVRLFSRIVLSVLFVTLFLQPSSAQASFTREMKIGHRYSEVKDLQIFLNGNGFTVAISGPGSPGKETDMFGPQTKAALAKWQKTVPSLSLGGGILGPRTRAYLNNLTSKAPVRAVPAQPKPTGPQPVLDPIADGYPAKEGDFSSAIVVDPASGKVMYEHFPNKVWTIASLSKLMTAMIALDRGISWNKLVTMTKGDEVGGARLRLRVGTKVTVKDLFYSSLVGSANNATVALARQTGLSAKAYVARMNKRAKELGLTNTVFYDTSGMDPRNKSTAFEMAILARKAFEYADIRAAEQTSEYSFKPKNASLAHTIRATNGLILGAPEIGVIGGKTGYLVESKYNFVAYLEPLAPLAKEPPLMIVVMGAPNMKASSESARALAHWAWKAYDWPSVK